jgi:hypothetical protein
MRHFGVAAACVAVCMLGLPSSRPAAADILVNISKSSQRMTVLVDGSARYNWRVSTGRSRYVTPNGVYQPTWLARKWRSRQYRNAPMPFSIFFHRGYAVHGTTEISKLGKPASHGCVRLHPEDAATLFALVKDNMSGTRIVVSNDVIEAPGQTPKKPSPLVAQKIETQDPAAPEPVVETAGVAPPELLVSERPSVPQRRLVAEKTSALRDMAQAPVKTRVKTAARAGAQPGFRW